MRRLAPLLILAFAVTAFAAHGVPSGSAAYLKLRAQSGIVQAVSTTAIREVTKPRVMELCGKGVGTCRTGDTTILLLEGPDGDTQEIEAKALPEWLATSNDSVRVLVRCARIDGKVRTTFLGAAPELDVLPAEEAYWRRLSAKRLAESRSASRLAPRALASRHASAPRSSLYGPIGRGSSRIRTSVSVDSQTVAIYAGFIRRRNPRLTVAESNGIAYDLIRFSLSYGIDARLPIAILIVESDFDPNAVSHSGAVGLGQLMPDTARWMGVQNSYDTTQNLYGMVKLLRTHMEQFGRGADDPIVLAAYNAGEGAVRRHGGVPPYRETQAYVQRVTAIYRRLRSGD